MVPRADDIILDSRMFVKVKREYLCMCIPLLELGSLKLKENNLMVFETSIGGMRNLPLQCLRFNQC